MSTHKEFKYHVIQLLDPPYKDFEKYVCVPNSWIRLRETSDGPALVKFPVEELSEIKKYFERQESENWTVLLAYIKYSSNSYKEAKKFIKILNKMMKQEQSRTKIVEDLPSTSDKIVVESKSSSETNEARTASTVNSDAEPVVKEVPMQIDLTNDEERTGRENSKAGTSESPPTTRRYLTRQALRMSLSGNNTVNLPDQPAKEDVPKPSPVEDNVNTKNNPENPPSANTKDLDPELVRKWQTMKVLRSVLGDNFKEELEKLHNEFSRNKLLLEKMQLAITKNCQTIEQLIELTAEVNNVNISDLDAAVKELETGMKEAKINENSSDTATGLKVQNATRKKEKKADKSDGAEVKNNNPVNKIRGQARKFTFPPEYDPNDSRWTLKHREKTSDLVELIPNSRVYINAIQLSNSKMLSKDSKTLARMLLLEIFTENALSICSLTGKKPNAFDFEGTSVRPGLDENARTILLNFVKQHAAEQKWTEFDSQLVVNTIRNKMHEIRNKHHNINVQK